MLRRPSLLSLATFPVLVALGCSGPLAGGDGAPSPAEGGGGAGGAGGGGVAPPDSSTGSSTPVPQPASAGGLTARIHAVQPAGDGPVEIAFDGCPSTAEHGAIVLYTWDFGDGTRATGASVKHTFSAGHYTVKLTVTGSARGSAAATRAFTVTGAAPRALVTDASGHPRLFVDAGHLGALKAGVAATPILGDPGYRTSYVAGYLLTGTWQGADFYRHTTGGCQSLLGAHFTSADGRPVQGSRAIGDCLLTITAGTVFQTDDAKAQADADAAIAAMVTMAGWPQSGADYAGFGRWDCGACPGLGSNLNNGELLAAVSIAFDLLHARMAPGDRDAIRDLLLREARFVFQASHDKNTWWSNDWGNNWQAVLHGGLGLAALALLGEAGLAPGEAEGWIARSVDRIDAYLGSNYDADGVNYEDAAHFRYGLEFTSRFFLALRNVRGEDHFGDRGGIVGKAARYGVFATDGNFDGIMPNDHAGVDPTSFSTQLLLASAGRDGFAQWSWDRVSGASRPAANAFPWKVGGDGDAGQLLYTALFYDPSLPVESPAGRLPLGRVYPTFGRALFRSSWEDERGLSLQVEAGVFGPPGHGKPNQGDFFLTGYGDRMVVDGGSKDAAPYNVASVDGQLQVGPKGLQDALTLYATTRSSLVTPSVDHVAYDTTKAYGAPLSHAYRDFLFVHPTATQGGYALVLDDLAAPASHAYDVALHFDPTYAVTQVGAGHLRAAGGGQGVEVLSLAPAGATEDTSSGLRIAAKGNGARFATLLVPTDAAHPAPALGATTVGNVSVFTVGSDTVLANPGGSAFQAGGVTSDGTLVLARGGATVAEVAAYGATSVTAGGEAWVTGSARASWVVTATADGVEAWVVPEGAASIDAALRVPVAGVEYVVDLDDGAAVQFVTADAAGQLALKGLSLATPRSIRIHRAAAPLVCP